MDGGATNESSHLSPTTHPTQPAGPSSSSTPAKGRGRPRLSEAAKKAAKDKRKAVAKDAKEDKKRRTTRASRQPMAPPSIDIVSSHPALDGCDSMVIAGRLKSDDPESVSWGLNGLLRASADVDANYCLGVGGEHVVQALVTLFDEAIGWDEEADIKEDDPDENLNARNAWDASSLSGKRKRWTNFAREKLCSPMSSSANPTLWIDHDSDGRILEMIIAILRNLSYVAQNLRFLAHSEGALRILIGGLYYRAYSIGGSGGTDDPRGGGRSGGDRSGGGHDRSGEDVPLSSHHSNMCVYAINALINLAFMIDVTGRQIFIDRVLLESDTKEVISTIPNQQPAAETTNSGALNRFPTYGLASHLGFGGIHLAKQYDAKAETLETISDSVIWGLVGGHVRMTLAIFPALLAILDPNDITTVSTSASGWHRPSVQAVLELLTALIENPDNKAAFLCAPDALLHRLTDLLFIPRLGPDSMDYVDPTRNVVSRVVALKLNMGYDATVDSDLRDRACEFLTKLTDLSTSLKKRLGMAPSVSGASHRRYGSSHDSTMLKSSCELQPSILRIDEYSSSHRMNVRLYDCLLSMISSERADAGSLASKLLSNLAVVPENKAGVLYTERRLLSMSAKDPHIANIVCNGIFNRVS